MNGAAATDVEVVNDPGTGRPSLAMHNEAARLYSQAAGGSGDISLSLSHTKEYALATVVVLCEN